LTLRGASNLLVAFSLILLVSILLFHYAGEASTVMVGGRIEAEERWISQAVSLLGRRYWVQKMGSRMDKKKWEQIRDSE
jgi:hypothetical protein